jgi:hypothetical protein
MHTLGDGTFDRHNPQGQQQDSDGVLRSAGPPVTQSVACSGRSCVERDCEHGATYRWVQKDTLATASVYSASDEMIYYTSVWW